MFREEEGKRDVWRIDDTGSISGSDRSCTSGDRNQRAETQYPDEEAKSTENREDSSDQSCGKAGLRRISDSELL